MLFLWDVQYKHFIINNPESNFSKDIVLLDVTPLSIGIESDNGIMTKIVTKGSKIPVKKFKYFKTVNKNDKDVNIKVYQGERELASDNYLLTKFNFNNLKNINNNENIIKVTISIDINSIIKVFVEEKAPIIVLKLN